MATMIRGKELSVWRGVTPRGSILVNDIPINGGDQPSPEFTI
jgi:hypothetical protein